MSAPRPTREQELKLLIERMLVLANPYHDDPNRRMPLAWAVVVLTNLLSYSASSQYEDRQRIEDMIEQGPDR
jgi:hypothetical protein